MSKCQFEHRLNRNANRIPVTVRYKFDTADPRTGLRASWIDRVQIVAVSQDTRERVCNKFAANVKPVEWDEIYDAAHYHLLQHIRGRHERRAR